MPTIQELAQRGNIFLVYVAIGAATAASLFLIMFYMVSLPVSICG